MRPKFACAAVVVAGALGLSSALHAASNPEDLIKYRNNTMEAIGGHMGAISLIIRGKVEQSPHLLEHTRALNATVKSIQDIFPEDSAKGDTRAKPEVWQKPEEFKKAVARSEQAAAAFLSAVEAGNQEQIAARFKDLGGACKNCHDNFRKEEKK